jgi:cell division protein FtsB
MLRTWAIAFAIMFSSTILADDTKVTITVSKSTDTKKDKPAVAESSKKPFEGKRAAVDVAILLDTSNSMDGLINQARNQIWSIIQTFATAKRNGQTPSLRVAVFEYGNTKLPAAEGYIRQVVPLTNDLDKVSEGLFALTTSGGDEYCGQVIGEAIKRLDWTKEPNNYKAIFIAGNEPFTQGAIDYHDSCRTAIQSGVVVNTIHCGAYKAGIDGKWQDGALLAEGEYFNINQDRAVRHIECPQDKVIIELNAKLNSTYLWYGKKADRDSACENQVAQDKNASKGIALRCATKASALYDNSSRDLVDFLADDKNSLVQIKKEELPEKLQQLSNEEQLALVKKMATERDALKTQISKLNRERQDYVAKERRKLAKSSDKTLGDVVVDTVRKQLKSANFQLEK